MTNNYTVPIHVIEYLFRCQNNNLLTLVIMVYVWVSLPSQDSDTSFRFLILLEGTCSLNSLKCVLNFNVLTFIFKRVNVRPSLWLTLDLDDAIGIWDNIVKYFPYIYLCISLFFSVKSIYMFNLNLELSFLFFFKCDFFIF